MSNLEHETSVSQFSFTEVVDINDYTVTFYFYTGKILSIAEWYQFIDGKNVKKRIICILKENNEKEYIDISDNLIPFHEGDILTFISYQIQNNLQKDVIPIIKFLFSGNKDYTRCHKFYEKDKRIFYSKKETILNFFSGFNFLGAIISLYYMNLPIFFVLLLTGIYTKILEKKSVKKQLNNFYSIIQKKIEKEKITSLILNFDF